jgi:HAD superfamily hydrolase (TIGR01509 family)
MALKGLIFDFDGLILDTEVPGFLAWKEIFYKFHLPFTYAHWAKAIGTGPSAYDPALDLCAQIDMQVDPVRIREIQLDRAHEILRDVPIQPGVLDFIKQAQKKGLKMAVASSSPRDWVLSHLNRLDLVNYFDFILTAEDVEHVKPAPDLFQAALEHLNIAATEAIVFEDSPNGITAARAAGIFVIAVPNEITKTMNTSHADMEVNSFLDLDVEQLYHNFESNY